MDLLEFVLMLGGMELALEEGSLHTMKEVGRIVETQAKAMIGDDAMIGVDISPLPAWAPLAEATLEDKEKLGYGDKGILERSGIMRNMIEYSANGHQANIGSDDDVLLWQELGTTGSNPIPPRSVVGGAALLKSDEIADKIWGAHEAILTNKGRLRSSTFLGRWSGL